jgi:hypothetical protein
MNGVWGQERRIHRERLARALAADPRRDGRIEILEQALVAPLAFYDRASSPQTFDGGAYGHDGKPCELSLHVKSMARNVPLPAMQATACLPGTHLYAGMLKNEHFGHFVAESLARLWATQVSRFDSVIFYLRDTSLTVPSFVQDTLDCISPKLSVHIVREPTRIERLIVPEQLCHPSIGFASGHPLLKQAFSGVASIDRNLSRKLYVSRSLLSGSEGCFLGESFIEERLQDEGYAILHPQTLPICDQFAAYAAADQLIFAEGSAMHLYALVARPEQRAFIIRRRPMGIVFDWQLASFGAQPLAGGSHILGFFIPERDGADLLRARARLDMPSLAAELREQGFISNPDWSWQPSTEAGVWHGYDRFVPQRIA